MSRWLPTLLLAAPALLSAQPPPQSAADAADALGAALAGGAADAVLELLAPELLVFEMGGAEKSRDEYQAHHLPWDLRFAAAVQEDRLDRRVYEMGDYALVATRSRRRGEYQGKAIDTVGTETLLLRRAGPGWEVLHIHWSSAPARD